MSAAEIRAAGKALRTAREKSIRKSGNQARRDLLAAAASATGGDRIYSGEPRGALSVMAKVSGGVNITNLLVRPTSKSAGQWAWANTGTDAGRRVHRSGRRRGTVMNHPGTKGRKAWDKTAEQITKELVKDLETALRVSIN